jgi:hypothetical protein
MKAVWIIETKLLQGITAFSHSDDNSSAGTMVFSV